jgi:hypothetical protein
MFDVTAFIEFFLFFSSDFSYYACVPLNSGWRTTEGMHTTVW